MTPSSTSSSSSSHHHHHRRRPLNCWLKTGAWERWPYWTSFLWNCLCCWDIFLDFVVFWSSSRASLSTGFSRLGTEIIAVQFLQARSWYLVIWRPRGWQLTYSFRYNICVFICFYSSLYGQLQCCYPTRWVFMELVIVGVVSACLVLTRLSLCVMEG